MSRDKSVWFAEEILLDAKLINYQLESGEWDAVEEMLRAEAQLSRDADTGRLRPKKASEYTLRLVAEVLHIMRLDVEQGSHTRATLAVAEQCLRLVRSCAAAGTKMQTYVSKDLSILDSMLALAAQYHHTHVTSRALLQQYDSCMTVLVQTLGNLVVNNPFNQIIVWDKFDSVILNALVGANERTASAAAMLVYNILLGQPHVLPDDVLLLNSLAYMYANGNTEYPDLIIEYLIGVENTYIEKLYSKLEPECRMLVLSLAYNILMSHETQDINVSVNFVRFMAHEFKAKSDLILKTVDKYVRSVEPQEVVFLLDILATASSMDAYLDTLQSDVSLFINCAFLLRAIHKLGKESDNFFSSVSKLYADAGRPPPARADPPRPHAAAADPPPDIPLSKNDSADNMLSCNETTSECTESESSEHYYECTDAPGGVCAERAEPSHVDSVPHGVTFAPAATADCIINRIGRTGSADRSGGGKLEQELVKVAFAKSMAGEPAAAPRKVSLEHKIDIDDGEPPLILDAASPHDIRTISEVIPVRLESLEFVEAAGAQAGAEAEAGAASSQENSPDEPLTEIHLKAPEVESPSETSPPLADVAADCAASGAADSNPAGAADSNPAGAADSNPAGAADSNPAGEQKEVKKSQNLSTDFNLSEQLEKILGITTGAARSEGAAAGGEARRGGGAQEGRAAERTARAPPSVKIHSPDNQSSRLGETDATNVKRCVSTVSSVEQHVAYGFKAALVRLLANLCWKHPANKRQMRELEVIPVLLDCCNIDERNPLIMQWVIYAVRNLCENCPENQEVISQMTLKAPVQSELLQEMGLSLHTDAAGNTLRIAPLPRGNP